MRMVGNVAGPGADWLRQWRLRLCIGLLSIGSVPLAVAELDCPAGQVPADVALLLAPEKENPKAVFGETYFFSELAITNPQNYDGTALASITPDSITVGESLEFHNLELGDLHVTVCVDEGADTFFAWGLYGREGEPPTLNDLDYFDQYAGAMVPSDDGRRSIVLNPIDYDCNRDGGVFDLIESRFPDLDRDDIDVQAICVSAGREMMRDGAVLTPMLVNPDRGYIEDRAVIWANDPGFARQLRVSRLVRSVRIDGELLTENSSPRSYQGRSISLTQGDENIDLCLGENGSACFGYKVVPVDPLFVTLVDSTCAAGEKFPVTAYFSRVPGGAAWEKLFYIDLTGESTIKSQDLMEEQLDCPETAGDELEVEISAELNRIQGFDEDSLVIYTASRVVTVTAEE